MSTSKGGRPIDPIWRFYVQKEVNNKLIVECISCKKVVSAKPCRMKEHQKKCSGGNSSKQQVGLPVDMELLKELSGSPENSAPAAKKKREEGKKPEDRPSTSQASMRNFVIKTGSKDKDTFDVAIAKFFYSCNIPFLASEHPSFTSMINLLRPGYTPPKRKQLAGNLLDIVHNEMQSEVEKKVSGKTVTLIQDGWSNIHNEPVIANCIHTGTECIFFNSINTRSEKKTSNYCADLAKEAITEVEKAYKCKVKGLVTDNENKMELMRQKIHEENPSIITYGCPAHYLHLLGQDITPESILKHVVSVQKYFRNHHRPSAWLKEFPDAVKPQIPGKTRWNSQIDCLESFIKNRPYFLQILEDHEDDIDDKGVVQVINNQMINKEVKHLLHLLKPIAIALNKVQRDDCSIADACEIWLTLMTDDNLMETNQMKVENRFHQAITPQHMLAYMFHPKYLGFKLSNEQEEKGRELLNDINPNFVPYIIAFQAKAAPFPETYYSSKVLENVSAST